MKSFFSKPGLTTFLLCAVVVLLLALVIHNMKGNPTAEETAVAVGSAEGDAGFDHSPMVYTAMKCPDDSTLTLDSSSCTGKRTEERRAMVKREFELKKSIREIFDDVIRTYGEAALTDEARSIRRSRKPL